MTRYIDADALDPVVLRLNTKENAQITRSEYKLIDSVISEFPTIDAVPTEFVMENCNLESVCYALTDDGEWCSEHCQYSEPQPECIHRYIDRIWRRGHGKTD